MRGVRVVVVGAGAWGLPTATELARRGHDTTVVDRFPPGSPWASSGGPTRLWRVADPDPALTRLGRRSLDAMRRLEARLGAPMHTRPGLLWRDSPTALDLIRAAVVAEGVPHNEVPAGSVGEVFPGLRPDERDALWLPEAGALLCPEALTGYQRLLEAAGGRLVVGPVVTAVLDTASGASVELADGSRLHADVAVLCAGPGTPALLDGLGLHVPLRPFLEQVVHVDAAADPLRGAHLPCLFDGPGEHGAGVYTMPTPGVGYKVGIDDPLRELRPDDLDRTPDPARTRAIVERTRHLLPELGSDVIDELVCCWTDSADGSFVIDRTGAVVVACGDAGKGFKYSPAIGEVLADLAEDRPTDPDVAAMSAARFADYRPGPTWVPTSLGGAPDPVTIEREGP